MLVLVSYAPKQIVEVCPWFTGKNWHFAHKVIRGKVVEEIELIVSIASQPGKFKSIYQKQGQFVPIVSKQISIKDHCVFGTNSRLLDSIGLFPAKRSINHLNSNFTTKTNTGDPQGSLTLHMHKIGSKFLNHKNSNNSEAISYSNLKCSHKLLTISAHHPAKFQPYTPSGSKVIAKKVHFLTHFKTLARIPFKTQNICKIRHYSYIYESSFQDHTQCHCNHHFCSKCKVRSFQDPRFSLFPGPWQVDNSFFSPWSSTGMQRTSYWHLMNVRVRSP